ncbi:MAG: hypothetical protein WD100_10750, partial [Tistlia sp.]
MKMLFTRSIKNLDAAPLKARVFLSWLAILFCLTLAFDSGAARAEEGWSIATQAGAVEIVRPGAQPVALTTIDRVSGGDSLITGPSGRVVLVRGSQTVIVAPNSQMSLPSDGGDGLG